jgi:hypothetical protein
MKMTEKQSKALQIFLGIVCAAALWLTIGAQFIFNIKVDANSPLNYLWIAVFAAIMITQRSLEKKFETRFTLFFRAYLITLIVGLVSFILYAVLNHISFLNS